MGGNKTDHGPVERENEREHDKEVVFSFDNDEFRLVRRICG